MNVQTLQLLAQYNAGTNEKMNTHIAALSAEQWGQAFGGMFNSVKSLCNHIYICDFIWLQRFSQLRPFRYIDNELFCGSLRLDTMYLTTVVEYLRLRMDMDAHIRAFVDEIRPEDVSQTLVYKDLRGRENSRNFGGLVLHMFNHQTHHRGMISLYLEEMGVDNDFSNLAAWV